MGLFEVGKRWVGMGGLKSRLWGHLPVDHFKCWFKMVLRMGDLSAGGLSSEFHSWCLDCHKIGNFKKVAA